MTDARKTMALALDALHAMVNAMLDRGVHTDPEHPYRQALNFACTARNALRTALEQQAEPVMLNGLTEAETNATASVMGLTRQAEPVAWMDREGDLYKMPEIKNWAPPHIMLYTTPPQRQWDKPSTSFNDWWNGDYDDSANPFEKDSAAYWSWAGWQAAQREWQGLTDEQRLSIVESALRGHASTRDAILWAIEHVGRHYGIKEGET